MESPIPTDKTNLPAHPETMLVTVSDQQVHRNNVAAWGKIMYESGSFPLKNMAAAIVKIQAGYELGFGVVASLRNIHVFDGNISVAAIGMAMKINQSPNYDYEVITSTDDECVIDFYGISKRTKQWRKLGTESFTKADVTTAKLSTKDNHAKYPKAMKFARAMSAGCRKYCAEVFNGAVYSPEEAAEFSGATVELDSEGNVTHVSDERPNGNGNGSGKKGPQNVTPIGDARSKSAEDRRKDLNAQIRALNGITKNTLNRDQMESILADMSSVLGRTFTKLTDISDEAAQAYINRKNGVIEQEPQEPEKAAPPAFVGMSQQTNAKLFVLLNAIGVKDKISRLAFATFHEIDITSYTELDEVRAHKLIVAADALQKTGEYTPANPWTWARAIADAADESEDEMLADAADPANAVVYCNACGVQTSPAALAQPHAADCEMFFVE